MKPGKLIGTGNTADVYEWEEGKVLKLFKQGYPYEAVKKEYRNGMAINDMDFLKPRAYTMITYEGKNGIIYDRIEGESLLDIILNTGNWQECAECMAKTHKAMINNEVRNVPYYKDFLIHHIKNSLLTKEKQKEAPNLVDRLPNGDTLCHGDFHPGNILVSKGNAYVIDFMNVCHGHYLYDIARTVFLTECAPVPAGESDRDSILYIRKNLSELYLAQMGVTKDMLQDYLTIISIVYPGESYGRKLL